MGDAAILGIDQPFKDVGKDIFRIKEAEIIKCYWDLIADCRIKDAAKCVRGAEPYGETEYKACKTSACIDMLFSVCEADVEKGLLAVVQDEINKHAVTKAWDLAIENYNKANEKLGEYPILKSFQTEGIKLDINVYIVKECMNEFRKLMAEREGE